MNTDTATDKPPHPAAVGAQVQRGVRPHAKTVADHIEQRLLTWRQQHMNKSGDRLALDDFMCKDSIADLVDFVCDEYALDALLHARCPAAHSCYCQEAGQPCALGYGA